MIERHEGVTILSGEASLDFINTILGRHPERYVNRDAYLHTLDQIVIEPFEDGFAAEIPNFIIPDELA